MKTNKNESGFSVVEALLVLVIVGLIGVFGWYVWHNRATQAKSAITQTTAQTPTTKSSTKTTLVPADPTKDWKPYSSTKGAFSFRYPTSWVQATSPDLCSDGLVLLGPT